MEQNIEVHSLYTDFLKTFDLIDHIILVAKFDFGVWGSIRSWFKSYLTGRIQQVKINNSESHYLSVLAGIS